MWRAIYGEPGKPARVLSTLDEVRTGALDPNGTLWIDFFKADESEVALLSNVFHLDPLAIEDCVQELQYPKVDDYGHYFYLAVHGVRPGSARGSMRTMELDAVAADGYLLTHREDEMRSINDVYERCLRQSGLLGRGAPAVLQAILAAQALRYVEEAEKLQEEAMEFEDLIFRKTDAADLEKLFDIKADIVRLRRVLGAQRDTVNRLARGEVALIDAKLQMAYRDVYDDLFRATEMLDMMRDLAGAILDTYMSITANRTNEIMKVLTILATFVLPLTVITGYFGMNFDRLHGIRWPAGELYVLGLLAACIGGLWVWLWRKKWI